MDKRIAEVEKEDGEKGPKRFRPRVIPISDLETGGCGRFELDGGEQRKVLLRRFRLLGFLRAQGGGSRPVGGAGGFLGTRQCHPRRGMGYAAAEGTRS
jgi:hypothetical protein